MAKFFTLCLLGTVLVISCAVTPPSTEHSSDSPEFYRSGIPRNTPVEGIATWYPSASLRLSASHAELPLGTRVRITNLQNNRQIIVTIFGRIPPGEDRIIDIAQEAAKNIGMNQEGTTPVRMEVLRGMRSVPPPDSE